MSHNQYQLVSERCPKCNLYTLEVYKLGLYEQDYGQIWCSYCGYLEMCEKDLEKKWIRPLDGWIDINWAIPVLEFSMSSTYTHRSTGLIIAASHELVTLATMFARNEDKWWTIYSDGYNAPHRLSVNDLPLWRYLASPSYILMRLENNGKQTDAS